MTCPTTESRAPYTGVCGSGFGVIFGLYWDNEEEKGNYYGTLGLRFIGFRVLGLVVQGFV